MPLHGQMPTEVSRRMMPSSIQRLSIQLTVPAARYSFHLAERERPKRKILQLLRRTQPSVKHLSITLFRISAAFHYDGADLDWEGPSTLAQKANEAAFVKELRTAFRAVDTTWLITMAIGASDWSGQWRDFATLTLYVDWFNAMEYDFHGSWSSIAGHDAPMNVGQRPQYRSGCLLDC